MTLRTTFIIFCGFATFLSSAVGYGMAVYRFRLTPGPADIGVLLITGLLVSLTASWIGYKIVQSIRRRLYEIEEAATIIGAGLLHHRVTDMAETDEIGQLARQFNRMGSQIEQQVILLQKLADENRELAEAAEIAATLGERQRLAQELHDSVTQQLFALTMLAASAESQFHQGSAALGQTLKFMSELSQDAQREMRALLLQLRPVELDGRNFVVAAQQFLQTVGERHDLNVDFIDDLSEELHAGVEEQLFRILQEAIANVLKHAHATSVSVRITSDATHVHLNVTDNGLGISNAGVNHTQGDVGGAPKSTGHGLGLQNMQGRAESLGGRLHIWPGGKSGTVVEVLIPKL